MNKRVLAEVNAEAIKKYMLAIGKSKEESERIARENKMAMMAK